MKIVTTDFVEGARNAEGIVVIIDVFRAFTTACFCFSSGAERILPVGSVEEAKTLASTVDGAVLVGEREGKKLPGFDYGNSPTEIAGADLSGRIIIQTTHAGTQGLVKAEKAGEVVTGAFVNAAATARYIKSRKPECVTLVRMGWKATTRSDEDDLCADYLESLLFGKNFAQHEIEPKLRKSSCSARFFDSSKPWSPPSDFFSCVKTDIFNFVLRAEHDASGRLFLAMCV